MTREQRQAVLDSATKIQTAHLRRYAGYFEEMSVGAFKALCPTTQTAPLSQGGTTVVVLTTPERDYVGVARCSLLDNYCKAIGREMALGRAIKQAVT